MHGCLSLPLKTEQVFMVRSMLSVPYFERALYDLPEEEVTAGRILALADEIEVRQRGRPWYWAPWGGWRGKEATWAWSICSRLHNVCPRLLPAACRRRSRAGRRRARS